MCKKIIAITGLKGSGKDTTADYITSHWNDWKKESFAGTLKDAVASIFGWDRKMLAGETAEDRQLREMQDEYWSQKLGYEVTPRNILQRVGTEVFRTHFHQNIWVDSLEKKIREHDSNVVIADCRFRNEIDMLRANGAIIIRVQRDPLPEWFIKYEQIWNQYSLEQLFDILPDLKDIHPSEWDWIGYDNPDYILKNDSDFNNLYQQIENYLGANNETTGV